MGKIVTGKCPFCGTVMEIEEGKQAQCVSCDRVLSSNRLEVNVPYTQRDEETASVTVVQYAQYVETPAAGLAYLENKFETMDWAEYEQTLDFEISDIATMVEKNKVTHADSADTWELEFKSLIIPMQHKVKGAEDLMKKLAEVYNPAEPTVAYALFDAYVRLVGAIKDNKQFKKTLEVDIRFYEKFGGLANKLADMRSDMIQLLERIDALDIVADIDQLDIVRDATEERNAKIAARLAAEFGYDVENMYQTAVNDYGDGDNSSTGLETFIKIRDYKDSAAYIDRINSLNFMFGRLIDTNGRLYFVEVKQAKAFNVNEEAPKEGENTEEDMEKSYKGASYSIYLVENGRKAEKPIAATVTKIICTYNGKIYYLEGNKNIKCLDTRTNTVSTIDKPEKGGDFVGLDIGDEKNVPLKINKGSAFMLKKLLHGTKATIMQKKGCLRRKKPVETVVESKNNAQLVVVDMVQNKMNVITEVVDVMDAFDDLVFYTKVETLTQKKTDKKGKETTYNIEKVKFYCLHTDTMTSEEILDEHARIHAVHDGKVVYSRYNPSNYNMNLFVYDLKDHSQTLIEDNIYDFFNVIDGKVYYIVGSYYNRIMYANDFDGNDRREIGVNIENIFDTINGWMYALKGRGHNTLLLKISTDGKRRVNLAFRFKELVEFTAGYLYYINYDNELCVTRSDGKKFRVITNNVTDADDVVIDKRCIYVLRKETIDVIDDKYYSASSLYSMDLDGNNVKKLCYGIDSISNSDVMDNRIFIHVNKRLKFKITAPDENMNMVSEYKYCDVEFVYVLDKETGEIKEIFRNGDPTTNVTHFAKKGCFRRKGADIESIVEQVEDNVGYERTDKMAPGEMSIKDSIGSIVKAVGDKLK